MLQVICETLYNTINYGGLISLGSIIGGLFSDIIWPILWRVLMIIGIVIAIFVSIFIIRYVIEEKKKEKAEQEYIDALKVKYGKYSKQELAEIYDGLMRYVKSINRAREAKKKEAYATSADEKLDCVIAQGAHYIIWDSIWKKYRLSVDEEYLHHDMAYLKRLI